MSGDELMALIVCLVIGVIGWKEWLGGVLFLKSCQSRPAPQAIAVMVPLLAASTLLFVLCRWSSHDVRSSVVYVLFYMGMGFGWTGLLIAFLPYAGLHPREDLLERRNVAAGLAIGGALIGGTLAFAGGNIGDGPGWWVVTFSSGLATITLGMLWVMWTLLTRVDEAITVDRDMAAGWRALGFFVGGGLIVGRAAAGNWQSAGATVIDFVNGAWPVLLVWALASFLDLLLRPSPSHPWRSAWVCGVIPALLLIAAGVVVIMKRGMW